MEDLSITLIQSPLHWENAVANLAMFEEKIWKIGKPTDVIVLPEMFSTGFSMKPAGLAEMMNQSTFKWMKQMASQTGALVIGSFIAKENGSFFNRLLWMQPDGSFRTYDKRHLFRMAEEHKSYTPGEGKFIGTWKGWNIFPLVCYDLRFPVWSRNGWNSADKRMNYDVLIYVANWPQPRVSQWDILLRARAIENLSYVVGVNRIADDGNGVPYNGHSSVIGPKGEEIFSAGESETICTLKLSYNDLIAHRTKFPAYLDADNFSID
ncbi:MAG TPA: amidohydrolase [Cyclobacteriaceae bacterium]|nr:amidohydrolase [Cyclobacteriaceae bacterium]